MNNVYVTLLSSKEYLVPVLVLNRNLKQLNCQYPLFVLVTNNIALDVCAYLQKEDIPYEIVPRIKYSPMTIDRWQLTYPTILNTASKIHLFNLPFYKVVYIDADSFFFISPDELFEKPDGSMYEDADNGQGLSGLFVCHPWCHPFEQYKFLIENTYITDGDLLNDLWFVYKTNPAYHISFEWLVDLVYINDNTQLDTIKGLHFCYKYKPWYYNTSEDYLADFSKKFPPPDTNTKRKFLADKYINEYANPIKQKFDL